MILVPTQEIKLSGSAKYYTYVSCNESLRVLSLKLMVVIKIYLLKCNLCCLLERKDLVSFSFSS